MKKNAKYPGPDYYKKEGKWGPQKMSDHFKWDTGDDADLTWQVSWLVRVENLTLIAQTHWSTILLPLKATNIVLAHQDLYFGSQFSGHTWSEWSLFFHVFFSFSLVSWFPGSCFCYLWGPSVKRRHWGSPSPGTYSRSIEVMKIHFLHSFQWPFLTTKPQSVDLRFSRIARDDPNSKKNWPAVGQSLASISSPNVGTTLLPWLWGDFDVNFKCQLSCYSQPAISWVVLGMKPSLRCALLALGAASWTNVWTLEDDRRWPMTSSKFGQRSRTNSVFFKDI